MGKMISPQNIATGVSVTKLRGQEGAVFARTFWHSVVLTPTRRSRRGAAVRHPLGDPDRRGLTARAPAPLPAAAPPQSFRRQRRRPEWARRGRFDNNRRLRRARPLAAGGPAERANRHRRTAHPLLRDRCQFLPSDPAHRCDRRKRGGDDWRHAGLRRCGCAVHVSRCRDVVIRPGHYRQRSRHARRGLAGLSHFAGRRDYRFTTRRDRRRSKPPARSLWPQDRSGSRLDRRGDDRGHRGEQRLRYVLRDGAEFLPDFAVDARLARRRGDTRYGRSAKSRGLRRQTPRSAHRAFNVGP